MQLSFSRRAAVTLFVLAGTLQACQCDKQQAFNKVTSKLEVFLTGNGEDALVELATGVAFGPVKTGTKATRVLKLKNAGNADLHFFSDPRLKSGGDSRFTLVDVLADGACEARADKTVVGVGGCAMVTVSFDAAALGPADDVLSLDTDDPLGVLEVPLHALGASPDVDLCVVGGEDGASADACTAPGKEPPSAKFKLVDIGQVAPARTLRLGNSGGLPLRVTSIALRQAGKEFAVTPATYAGTLAPGLAVELSVTFVASTGGARTATLEVFSDDPDELPAVVKLVAAGDAPQLCPDPLPLLDFGDVEINATKDLTATFNNCGTRPLDVNSLTYTGSPDITITPPATPVTLNGGDKAVVTVHYAPKDLGRDDGKIKVTSTDPRTPVGFINVKGNGVTPPACNLEASSAVVDFGTVASGFKTTRLLTVHNSGKLDCKIPSIAFDAAAQGARFVVEAMTPPPFTLPPNGITDIRLAYQPQTTSGSATGVFQISNNSPAGVLSITLKGTATPTPECHLGISPGAGGFGTGRQLRFGFVKVNTDKALPMTLTNTGSADCFITSAALGSATDMAVFKILGVSVQGRAATYPAKLQPGEVGLVNVNFHPTSQKDWDSMNPLAPNEMTVQTTEKTGGECAGFFGGNNPDGCKKIGLVGSGAASGIEVSPGTVEFGQVTVGCNSVDQSVTVYNIGKTDVQIQKISVDPTTAPFKVVQAPITPLTLAAGKSFDVKVRYRPPDVNAHLALLVIDNDASNNKSYTVQLKGQGTTTTHQKDIFSQATDPKTDVLFVMDNSGSMSEEQSALAANAQAFVNAATASANDFQLGVVSTDIDTTTTSPSGKKCEPGVLIGPPKIITRTTPNAGAAFADNLKLGTNGSSDEVGLEAAHKALSSPLIDDPAKNLGFLRKDAKLAIIIISDEEDHSNGTVDFYVDFFQRIKGARNSSLVSVHAITGPGPSGCNSANGNSEFGARYIEAASRTGGLFRSICSSDWGRIANDLGLDAFAGKAQYFLTRYPDPATIVVTVNGVKQVAGVDYDYDSTANSINFKATKLPAKGSTVVAEYDTLCL